MRHKQSSKPITEAITVADKVRFMEWVTIAPGGCWTWEGYKDEKGYGQFRLKHRAYWAHRVSFTFFVKPIPKSLTINHKRDRCRNPSCVNPDHLELMDLATNSSRMDPPTTDCPF